METQRSWRCQADRRGQASGIGGPWRRRPSCTACRGATACKTTRWPARRFGHQSCLEGSCHFGSGYRSVGLRP